MRLLLSLCPDRVLRLAVLEITERASREILAP
jgi:hypothetical protein